jgi:DNA-binding CsgD family transcriptional regulator
MSVQTPEMIPVNDVPVSAPFGVLREYTKERQKLALLTLSHSVIEHRIYSVMYAETLKKKDLVGLFGVRRLLALSGMRSHSSVHRGCSGLIEKLSIEYLGDGSLPHRPLYRVFSPDDIFRRRGAAGIALYPKEISGFERNKAFSLAIENVIGREDLSRREALVILCCVEGLSNGEIAERLRVSEQTVKFHLRYIFDKFSVRRRTELVSHLLTKKFKANGHYK